jgi:hypothetical protein
MTEQSEALRGWLSKMRDFAQDTIDQSYPASSITFEALRATNPELAKAIFREAVIEPAKRVLRNYPTDEAFALLDGLEDQFLQVPAVELYFDAEVIVATRLMWGIFERTAPEAEKFVAYGPMRDQHGVLTDPAWFLAKDIARDIATSLAGMAGTREQRVQILLAAVVAGKAAVDEATATHTGYRRGGLLRAVSNWLGINKISRAKQASLMEQLEKNAPDEYIQSLCEASAGFSFLKLDDIRYIAHEMLSGKEYIKF